MAKSKSDDLKETVKTRANGCCEYCKSQERFSSTPFSKEHILPSSKGGSDELSNFALSCQGCNNHKYNHVAAIDPVTGRVAPLFNPRTQDWHQHFIWSVDCTSMIGITPTGRATIEKLKLNRPGLVNLRRELFKNKKHPPQTLPTSSQTPLS